MNRAIVRLDQNGHGVLPDGDRVAFGLPGEKVDETGTVVPSSPDRVAPPCPHFGTCGGCALQHASDGFVARWKVGNVARALKGRELHPAFGRFHRSPPSSRRRATLSARRGASGVALGFHAARSHDVVSIDGCRVISPTIAAALPALELLAQVLAPDKGALTIAATETLGGLDLDLSDVRAVDAKTLEAVLADAATRGIARITVDGETVAVYADPVLDFDAIRVGLPAGGFLQATRAGETALRRFVHAGLEGTEGPVADLFAGCGTFALSLARDHAVHAVEGDTAAIAALTRAAANASGLKPVTTDARDLFRRPLLAAELSRFAAVVIDPPRAGAQAQVAEIAASRVETVVHVSCNPVTFAREARTLVDAGFTMGRIDVVDQFLWSTHVELAAVFSRS